MTEEEFMKRFEAMGRAYNAPPETPREAIWDAIEEALDQEPPDEVLKAMRADDSRPTETPRAEMWEAIEGSIAGTAGESVDVVSLGEGRRSRAAGGPVWRRQWTALATAAVALLVLGVGLGRMSVGPADAPEQVAVEAPAANSARAFRAVAVDHLSRTESVLTMMSSDARAGRVDAEVSLSGRALLRQTRLLLDSPAAEDQVIRELLEDLEVILIQVAQLTPGQFEGGIQGDELDLLNEGLDDKRMMLRIRSVLPTGAIQAGI